MRWMLIVALLAGLQRPADAGDNRGLELLGETLLGAATGAAGFGAGYLVGRVAFDTGDDGDDLGPALTMYGGYVLGAPIGVLLAGPGYKSAAFPAYFGSVLGVLAGGISLAIVEDGPLAYASLVGFPLLGSVITYNIAMPTIPVAPVVRTTRESTVLGLAGSF